MKDAGTLCAEQPPASGCCFLLFARPGLCYKIICSLRMIDTLILSGSFFMAMLRRDPIRILLVEEDEDDYIIVRDQLSDLFTSGSILCRVRDYNEALDALLTAPFDVCLLDYQLGGAKRNRASRRSHSFRLSNPHNISDRHGQLRD